MNNLMKELMAEAERVAKLETEVKRTTTNLNNEITLAREEKMKKIAEFVNELNEFLRSACPGEKCLVGMSVWRKDGNFKWRNYLQFGYDDVYLGRWFCGSGDFLRDHLICEKTYTQGYGGKCDTVASFIDQWTDETKDYTERCVVETVRKVLASRIEKATESLKEVNDKHAEICGREN